MASLTRLALSIVGVMGFEILQKEDVFAKAFLIAPLPFSSRGILSFFLSVGKTYKSIEVCQSHNPLPIKNLKAISRSTVKIDFQISRSKRMQYSALNLVEY